MFTDFDKDCMRQALSLARLASPFTSPNPLVGAVIVKDEKIIGKGYHKKHRHFHAEVNAINSVLDKNQLRGATIYINLEPCAHTGSNPPCVEYLIENGFRRVVYAIEDPNPCVSGEGARLLREAGIQVDVGLLANDALHLNRHFLTFHRKNRPYITLKWAETSDGFIARKDYTSRWISSQAARLYSHILRAGHQAILVGYRTAIYDDPELTVRGVPGNQPLKFVADDGRQEKTHSAIEEDKIRNLKLFSSTPYARRITLKDSANELFQISQKEKIISLMVEGGSATLTFFIKNNLWDEAHIFRSPSITFLEGIQAPTMLTCTLVQENQLGEDRHLVFRNKHAKNLANS